MQYQDYGFIAEAIAARADFANTRNKELVIHKAWNILCGINCKNSIVFETIINDICNAFNEGGV